MRFGKNKNVNAVIIQPGFKSPPQDGSDSSKKTDYTTGGQLEPSGAKAPDNTNPMVETAINPIFIIAGIGLLAYLMTKNN